MNTLDSSIETWSSDGAKDPFVTAAEDAARRSGASETEGHPSEDERDLFNKLMDWRATEKDRSQAGRDEMATDADFRDGLQWSAADAQVLRNRGQEPVSFNRVLPHVEWLLGTERRTRTDFKVLPRTKDDVGGAQAQGDVLKYLGDVNKSRFHRSRAFDDAVTVGVGWIEDAVNPDPTEEAIACRYENWRNVWHDSASNELDLADARYIFRERWVDLDVAISMWPKKAAHLKMVAEGYDPEKERDEQFYMGNKVADWEPYTGRSWNGFVYQTSGTTLRFGNRQRVRIIEFQFRAPCSVTVCVGSHNGEEFDEKNTAHTSGAAMGDLRLWKTSKMRMHYAMMTERGLLDHGRSPYRHDKFSLTPIWCYRRARDGQPYGVVRNLRGIQEDVNKRFARSLYRISSQQVTVSDDATDDWTEFKEQIRDPNGVVRVKRGATVEWRTDFNMAEGDLKLMATELALFQDTGGLTNENMGRETNAQSGRAVLARQAQGSIITERIFDNLRMAVQASGEKQLSLVRQFMTEARILRLTDARGKPSWLYVNQADPTTGKVNDITATQSDFVVSEQDFRAGVRQAMFDTLMQLLTQLPPELSVQLLDLAIEFSDVPNKDEFVARLRKITGHADPSAPDTPEGQAQQQAQAQAAAQAEAIKQRAVELELGEKQAKIEKLQADTKVALASMGQDGQDPTAHPLYAELQALQQQLADSQQQLAQVQIALKDRTDEVLNKAEEAKAKADAERYKVDRTAQAQEEAAKAQAAATVESERVRGEAAVKVAEVEKDNADVEARLQKVIDALAAQVKEMQADMKIRDKEHAAELKAVVQDVKAETREAKVKEKEKAEPAAAPAAAAAPIVVQVDNSRPDRIVTFEADKDGNIIGAKVSDAGGSKAAPAKPKPTK